MQERVSRDANSTSLDHLDHEELRRRECRSPAKCRSCTRVLAAHVIPVHDVKECRDIPPDAALPGGDNRLNFIEFWILPKFAAILQDIGCDQRDILPVIPFDDVQGEVNA